MVAGSLIDLRVHEELCRWVRQSRSPRLRSMLQWAEQELVVPDGPCEGQRFRAETQPFAGLALRAMGYGLTDQCNRLAVTGPTQTGKTLIAYVVPICYHLFEIGETVVCGLPDMDMAADKWREDLLPIIERTRYRELLPRTGGGSRGGKVEAIRFRNGATLKFMSGGGGDKSRAGFTTRVLVCTEVDGMDEPGEASREADKITQLEARTRAYGQRKRVYLECTVTIKEGRIWQEYTGGTESRILLPCPHCRQYVYLDRKHLVGWEEAESEIEARQLAFWACPACGEAWTEEERAAANRAGVLAHRGQEVTSEGCIVGAPPQTDTLGVRRTAANNLFATAGDVGTEEWLGRRDEDEENAEKELCQFVHCEPYQPPEVRMTPLTALDVRKRTDRFPRGLVPMDTTHLTVGIDLGKWLAHYAVVAWRPGGSGHVCDYGVLEIDSDRLGSQVATLTALREFRDQAATGWTQDGGGTRSPDQVWIDSGWHETKEAVYQFVRESDQNFYRPTKGFGATQQRDRTYRAPTRKTNQIRLIGDEYHITRIQKHRVLLVHVNADHWKTQVHERFAMAETSPGALTIFHAPQNDHMKFSKHLTAEQQTKEFIAGKGEVVVWKQESRNNHWLDAMYLATAAAHLAGVRLGAADVSVARPRRTLAQMAGRAG